MQNLLLSFFNDFLSTLFLFILSGVVVISAKALSLYLSTVFPKPKETPPVEKEQPIALPKKPQRKRTQPKPQKPSNGVITSIEIDPSKVDRIYVKKVK